ncbi:MAG: fumarylacetoacetate hydrolase family protein [Pseudomonadales bacterium]
MKFAVPAEPRKTLSVKGSEASFPVNNVYCVGRNYADHAVEMGHDPSREPPFFFMKPAYAVLAGGGVMQYPNLTGDVHHEVELVLALARGGENISEQEALDCVFGYGVGIDMTRRDIQAEAKQAARPWDAAKVFLHSAPCSELVASAQFIEQAEITLTLNGEQRQVGNVNQMIWKLPEIISRLSQLFPLYPGDLIFTGTPAGVGPIVPGDVLQGHIESVGDIAVTVSGPEARPN